jgi:uncharacterized surface protein with fasciclin (FAS1) repeats
MVALGIVLATETALAERVGRPGPDTIAQIVVDSASADEPEFTILLAALEAVEEETGFIDALSGKRPYTVFAPTDAAFAVLLVELDTTAEALLADTDLVAAVLAYHVTLGRRFSQSIVNADEVRMIDGNPVFPDGTTLVDANDRIVNLAVPDGIDLKASNGVIHVIDRVLLPPM